MPDDHARPRRPSLYDKDIPTPTHAERARTMAEGLTTGTLCTAAAELGGHPYGSFVTFALDEGGAPVFLISEIAEHTRNLRGDPRCSLLVAEPGEGDPLARGRVTLIGTCAPAPDPSARATFLAAHPNASYYADFKDFAFWRLDVTALRYIGGYGRMSWVEPAGWAGATPDPLAGAAAGIIQHMNEDHADALVAYCLAYSRAESVSAARMTGVDRYGFEMSATTPEGPRPIRVAFGQQISRPDEVRVEMVRLVRAARAKLGG